jgi:hypothetical protein
MLDAVEGILHLNMAKTGLGDAGALHMANLLQSTSTLQAPIFRFFQRNFPFVSFILTDALCT